MWRAYRTYIRGSPENAYLTTPALKVCSLKNSALFTNIRVRLRAIFCRFLLFKHAVAFQETLHELFPKGRAGHVDNEEENQKSKAQISDVFL